MWGFLFMSASFTVIITETNLKQAFLLTTTCYHILNILSVHYRRSTLSVAISPRVIRSLFKLTSVGGGVVIVSECEGGVRSSIPRDSL